MNMAFEDLQKWKQEHPALTVLIRSIKTGEYRFNRLEEGWFIHVYGGDTGDTPNPSYKANRTTLADAWNDVMYAMEKSKP